MTETDEQDEENTKKSKDDSRILRQGKRISTSVEMALLQLLEKSKSLGKKTALTHEQIAERAYWLWQQKGSTPEPEQERLPQKEPNSSKKSKRTETKKRKK